MIARFGKRRWRNVVIVDRELGIELGCLALHESVKAVEAALQRPVLEGSTGRAFRHRREMPLARRIGRVSLVAENLRDRGGRGR